MSSVQHSDETQPSEWSPREDWYPSDPHVDTPALLTVPEAELTCT